jgi:ATP-dependent DNA helicase RecG
MLVAVAADFQTVLMAPTEVLASQHWNTIERLLANSRVKRLLLTGKLTAAQRREGLAQIAAGEVQLVVGTQAVIQHDVSFAKLGLVVIDEQHKFGVSQRARFATGRQAPHTLVMTATPIPRSLCLTQFGDLDLTVMTEMPPGRQKVVTSRVPGGPAREKVWDFLRQKLRTGRQAYVICPRIGGETESAAPDEGAGGDGPGGDGLGAEEVFTRLSQTVLSDFRVGLVHGQLDPAAKAAAMEAFRSGRTQVLVATTVVEVGVDVPNATLMVVNRAESFGLSQLHQLRGRISRGSFQGYCFLFAESEEAEINDRLQTLEQHASGFDVAEADFRLRGPGDILGTRQSGELPLAVADLVRDAAELTDARTAAFELVNSGAFDQPAFAPLKIRVLERFGQLFDLAGSG